MVTSLQGGRRRGLVVERSIEIEMWVENLEKTTREPHFEASRAYSTW